MSAKVKPIEEWTRAGKDAARAILLEKSPYGVDGGELVGRDPRSYPPTDLSARLSGCTRSSVAPAWSGSPSTNYRTPAIRRSQ